jgi:hypothetical protein
MSESPTLNILETSLKTAGRRLGLAILAFYFVFSVLATFGYSSIQSSKAVFAAGKSAVPTYQAAPTSDSVHAHDSDMGNNTQASGEEESEEESGLEDSDKALFAKAHSFLPGFSAMTFIDRSPVLTPFQSSDLTRPPRA